VTLQERGLKATSMAEGRVEPNDLIPDDARAHIDAMRNAMGQPPLA